MPIGRATEKGWPHNKRKGSPPSPGCGKLFEFLAMSEALKETLLRSDFDRVRQHPKYKVRSLSVCSAAVDHRDTYHLRD